MVFNLCLLTYTFPSNLWVKNIIQASNEDGPGYVTKVAISESEQLIILEKLSHFWDNITQVFQKFGHSIESTLYHIFPSLYNDLNPPDIILINKGTRSTDKFTE
ncbi:Alpha-1,4-glucan:maltose-1-phosphate maltosyltransferase [Dirofilaria immitis]